MNQFVKHALIYRIYESINNQSQSSFDEFTQKLDNLNIEYIIDNTIVRGLDYYNDLVFEWK